MPLRQQWQGAQLASALSDVPKELQKQVRPVLRKAAEPILQDAKRRASWSRRIPKSLVIRTSFSGRKQGVRIVARKSVAPHARPFEGLQAGARSGFFRHPVFGQDRWANQETRPSIVPAVEAGRPDVLNGLAAAVRDSARRASSGI